MWQESASGWLTRPAVSEAWRHQGTSRRTKQPGQIQEEKADNVETSDFHGNSKVGLAPDMIAPRRGGARRISGHGHREIGRAHV